jgi:four helix bundle protein
MSQAQEGGWRFEDLEVFKRAYRLSLEVHRATLDFPRNEQFGRIADQLRRSSKSICALVAEGSGRQRGSAAEFRRYLVMALGSADETRLWCRYAHDLGYLPDASSEAWQNGYREIARMLQGFIARLD